MEKQCRYMVKRDGKMPTLLRLEPDEEYKVFTLEASEYHSELIWTFAKDLVDIIEHRERFPEYTEISEEEAKEIKRQMKAEWDRIEKERNILSVEHTQKETEKGIVEIDIYRKANKKRPVFRDEDLEELLSGLADKEHMVIQKIHYCYFDEWGYYQYGTATKKEDIDDVYGSSPLAIDGYFTDEKMNYRFMYIDDERKVIVAKCLKESGIDLEAVFDEKTNYKAGGYFYCL